MMDLHKLVGENQSIKIIPPIDEYLRSTGFNTNLDQQTNDWFLSLINTWKTWKNSAKVEDRIEIYLRSSPEPFRIALAVLIKCAEFKDCKPKSLPYKIVATLKKLSQEIGLNAEEELKLHAFRIAIHQRNQEFLTLVINTYNIISIKNLVIPIVKDLIAQEKYKHAAQITISMELFDDIPAQDILFPLVLQDKTCILDDYLMQCPSQVMPFLQFLDKLLNRNYNIKTFAESYIEANKISNVKFEKLHSKPLGKLVARLCNKFKVPIATCKNLSKNRTFGGLRYLVYQKYSAKNVTSFVWEDLVKDALDQNPESAIDFIDFLTNYDKKEALKWANYLNLSDDDYPQILKHACNEQHLPIENYWDHAPSVSTEYYKLSIGSDQIVMIDTPEKFLDMCTVYLKDCVVFGLDCEWKPSFGTIPLQLALIQISIKNTVYLIDTLILNKPEYSGLWHVFNKSLLDNAEIIKVGFGLEQDFKEMKSIVGLSNIKTRGEGILDLTLLWKGITNVQVKLPYISEDANASLSSLVKCCFNLPLEKKEQCSNWELRPLRQTQIEYAALDAYVLIEIYFFLQHLCYQQGINFEEICNEIMSDSKHRNTKKSKTVHRLLESFPEEKKKRTVQEVKLFVDGKLSYLMSYLRYLGMDTVVISTTMLWHDVINLAISEERFILLSKIKMSPSKNYPQSSILEVCPGEVKDQMQYILTHFNIKVLKTDGLNRCIYCNNIKFRKLNVANIEELYKGQKLNNAIAACNQKSYNDIDNHYYDNFLSDDDDDDDLCQPDTFYKNSVATSSTTSTGVPIDMSEVYPLLLSQKVANLCESCGKLLWEDEAIYKQNSDLVSKLNLTI